MNNSYFFYSFYSFSVPTIITKLAMTIALLTIFQKKKNYAYKTPQNNKNITIITGWQNIKYLRTLDIKHGKQ